MPTDTKVHLGISAPEFASIVDNYDLNLSLVAEALEGRIRRSAERIAVTAVTIFTSNPGAEWSTNCEQEMVDLDWAETGISRVAFLNFLQQQVLVLGTLMFKRAQEHRPDLANKQFGVVLNPGNISPRRLEFSLQEA